MIFCISSTAMSDPLFLLLLDLTLLEWSRATRGRAVAPEAPALRSQLAGEGLEVLRVVLRQVLGRLLLRVEDFATQRAAEAQAAALAQRLDDGLAEGVEEFARLLLLEA